MKLLVLLFALMCLWIRLAMGADALLEWDASATAGVTNYRVSYGQTSRVYAASRSFGTNLSALITNLVAGRWFFSATAWKAGIESDPSNELGWTNTAFSPVNLRITGPRDALALQSAASPAGPWKTLAVVTSTNAPLQLTIQPREMFRAASTNLPPLPGGAR
jgi:hypothetical protein